MKKVPWGIIAGICAIVAFFAVVGTIAAFMVLNSIAGATHTSATLFDEWYQTVLFILSIISVLGLIASTVMWFLRKRGKREVNNETN